MIILPMITRLLGSYIFTGGFDTDNYRVNARKIILRYGLRIEAWMPKSRQRQEAANVGITISNKGVNAMKNIFIITIMFILAAPRLYAAVGCDLNDPDRDVKRLFPGSTGFKTVYVSIDRKGGQPMLQRIQKRLGDSFHGLYETIDVPYTLYEIYRGKEKIGYIHGVNQKGQYGGIQVFLSLDLKGIIKSLYFQKLTNREAALLRRPSFSGQFIGLTLDNFKVYDIKTGKATLGPVANIRNPAAGADQDFRATLRAVKKNLILMDEFVYENR